MFYNLKKVEQISIIFMCYIEKVLACKRMVHFSHLTSCLSALICTLTYGAKIIYFQSHAIAIYCFIEKYIHELSEQNSG